LSISSNNSRHAVLCSKGNHARVEAEGHICYEQPILVLDYLKSLTLSEEMTNVKRQFIWAK
jgi:hypothetical protein